MHPIPLAPFPGEGGHDAEGAACLWDVQAYSYLCYALSVTCGDSSPKGGAKTYIHHTHIEAFLPLPAGEVAAAQR